MKFILFIYFRRNSESKGEKRLLNEDSSDNIDENASSKKAKVDEISIQQTTESILDDICLDDIESRISVHVLETPEACTHEVAVYPGKQR